MILKNNYEKNMTIKIFITYFLIIIHILFGLLLVLFFPLLTNNYRNLIIKIWCSVLLRILAVEIDIHNLQLVKNKDVFFVANHISWMDIILINSIKPCIFVAKASVKSWPIFGLMASSCKTIFLNRSSRSSIVDATNKIKKFISNHSIFIFPEGTSTNGVSVGKFHSNFFQIPIDLEISTYPVAIKYTKDKKFTDAPVYIGDDTIIQSIFRIIKSDGFRAHVIFCKQLTSHVSNRKDLAKKAQESIKNKINLE
jgi:1-acyl-sn-glycerol-3-phosphate acyltransferase